MSDLSEMIELRKQGDSVEDIAEALDIGSESVRLIFFEEANRMNDEDIDYAEIADQLGFSEGHINNIVSAMNAGFKNVKNYKDHLLNLNGFSTQREYQNDLARKLDFLSKYDLDRYRLDEDKFGSEIDFFKLRAKELRLSGLEEYYERFDELCSEIDANSILRMNGFSDLCKPKKIDRKMQTNVDLDSMASRYPFDFDGDALSYVGEYVNSLDHRPQGILRERY
jgi:aryl carrier-like protein|tara:strand:- start:4 stop:675 length:672 start_codon:yes stop_codon:yes gene_type:complete